jgi:hypothetical protein
MTTHPIRIVATALLAASSLLSAACATVESEPDEGEPVYVSDEATAAAADAEAAGAGTEGAEPDPTPDEPEVPIAVAESERPVDTRPSDDEVAEVVVKARVRGRDEQIRDLVAEAKAMLRDVELRYVFTGKGRRETLRGRPVAFALWSESAKQWTIAHLEIPRPPVKWKPGGRPLRFTTLTPGITARHVKGTGAERLMFAFASKTGEPLKVYGRKFPVFDDALIKRKRWRAAAQSAKAIVYLPFTEDTLDPLFVEGGRQFLLATARKAVEELRAANVPSAAFPGQALADVVPPEVITTLAVIEQTDDTDYTLRKTEAFNEVLSQYGLKREEAYRYSVSRARAIGPMQFTNRRGNGTYSLVVRRCRGARIDPDFERGATNLLNAMKAAICLFDIELAQMAPEIRTAYRDNKKVLGIFPVAAYNGGPRNVTKLYRVIQRMQLRLEDLRPPGEQPEDDPVACPCLWAEAGGGVQPVSIPRYNNENRWYVQKYQSILGLFDESAGKRLSSN